MEELLGQHPLGFIDAVSSGDRFAINLGCN
jgi:hypothetical protein